jgi:Fe-S oxidoreductase
MGQRAFGAQGDSGRTFCCGSGGGCFWKEEEKGTTRINHMRFDQIAVANPETLAVGCPFCMTMMEDASQIALPRG